MRILVVSAFYPPHQIGGYEIRCKQVVDDLVKRGHDALIITTQCPTRKCEIHDHEHSIKRVLHSKRENRNIFIKIKNDIKDLKFIDQIVKKNKPDIIYLWGIQTLSNVILPYFSDLNIQIVYDEGSSELFYLTKIHKGGLYFSKNENDPSVKRLLKKYLNWILNLMSLNLIKPQWSWPNDMQVYFNSNSALRYSQEGGVPVDNARVIFSGIEIAQFPFLSRDQIGSPVRIITPGRIKPIKGTKDVIYLAEELRKRNVDIKLILVGKVESNEYYDEILQEMIGKGLGDVIEYLPMVSQMELAHLYQVSDICFVPSYLKPGLSRVLLEAMSSGCVVLAYGNEGSRDIICNWETGFIVSEGDIRTVADVIDGLIKNPAIYREIAQNARLKIENDHPFDKYVDAIEAYLIGAFWEYEKR